MTKAEQEWSLIEALVYCKGKRLTKKSCAGCPYAGAGCAIDATIAKLKAQEPRVMTLEAVKELHPDDDVYIERISSITGAHYIYATTVWRVVSKSIKFSPDNATLWFSEYGETWRCWKDRPNAEQREETAWDR